MPGVDTPRQKHTAGIPKRCGEELAQPLRHEPIADAGRGGRRAREALCALVDQLVERILWEFGDAGD